MRNVIDNTELDPTNLEFNQAADFVNSTNKVIFLTGKAGTGKTLFLKYIKSLTDKSTIILAPTGVAAINAGGITINSFFQIPFGPFVPNDRRLRTKRNEGEPKDTIYDTFTYRQTKKDIINGLELLIIDEISMVRCDMLDVIDRLLKVFRNKQHLPFGGVQVILIGDVFQLPPIAKEYNNEWQILSQFYDSRYFFSSKIMCLLISEKKYVHFELKKVYRQKEQGFIDLLNRIRVNELIDGDIQQLNNKFNPSFFSNNADNFITLSTDNNQVNRTNQIKLDELKPELKVFKGEITGEFPKNKEGDYVLPVELNLQLKEGAQVMFLRNDLSEGRQYFNGKIGKVKSLSENYIEIDISDGETVLVQKAVWHHIEYIWNQSHRKVEEKIKGTFSQYPIKLAWSITVHKSQGLTFEKVFADLANAFDDGQVYVALSRCSSFAGLHLKTKIQKSAIRANFFAIEFSKNATPNEVIMEQLNEGKADVYYKKSRESFKKKDFSSAFDNCITALKFRNDMETKIFKRYLTTIIARLTKSRLQRDVDAHRLAQSLKLNELLNADKEHQTTKINEQNESTKLLLTQIEEQKIIIERIDELNKLQHNEITRLKNLKWYQKV